MRKVKLDNDDLIQYLNTIKALKKYPTMSEYREEYRRLRTDGSPLIEAKKFKSAHTELLRLDRKKKSLLEKFIEELNPVSHASALASRKLEKVQESIIYRKSLLEKSPDELVALVIKQRAEAAIEFQRSVEQSLEQLQIYLLILMHQQQSAENFLSKIKLPYWQYITNMVVLFYNSCGDTRSRSIFLSNRCNLSALSF